jgi:hypothetical protein
MAAGATDAPTSAILLNMPRYLRHALLALGTVSLVGVSVYAQTKRAPAPIAIAVFKTPTCGCCGKWVEYMERNGFKATVTNLPDTSDVRAQHGVPARLGSCHTSVVGGYAIEGHVPADDVKRLLREKPAIVGLSAPGMPNGSPGMDIPNSPPYEVVAFTKDGQTSVFSTNR